MGHYAAEMGESSPPSKECIRRMAKKEAELRKYLKFYPIGVRPIPEKEVVEVPWGASKGP